MIEVAIVDDNRFLIQTLLEKLNFFDDIVCKFTADNGQSLLSKFKQNTSVQLVLMDIQMPEMNGIEATTVLKQRYPWVKVIMLTVFDNHEHIAKAIKAGADGYLLKDLSPEDLYKAITNTMSGGATMAPSVAMKTLEMLRQPMTFDNPTTEENNLSERETEVLRQLATGITYGQIATNLFVSPGTIRKHIENIYAKLQVHNKLEAIQKARLYKIL